MISIDWEVRFGVTLRDLDFLPDRAESERFFLDGAPDERATACVLDRRQRAPASIASSCARPPQDVLPPDSSSRDTIVVVVQNLRGCQDAWVDCHFVQPSDQETT